MNRLFVAYKPKFISSNNYLSRLKRRYGEKRAGFSGTLDPFASGTLIVAMGAYTKLLPYIKKSPKRYKATLWLGASSKSLDLENISNIEDLKSIPQEKIRDTIESLEGKIHYAPPAFCAKKISGKRAYKLAREGSSVDLKKIDSIIYKIKLIHYNHPFVHFEAIVSEGTYIRSIGEIIAQRLKLPAALSSLERTAEGDFVYDDERALDAYDFLDIKECRYLGDERDLRFGKKLCAQWLDTTSDGTYLIKSSDFNTIVELNAGGVSYKLNLLPKSTEPQAQLRC